MRPGRPSPGAALPGWEVLSPSWREGPPPASSAGKALLALYWVAALWLVWLIVAGAGFGVVDDHVFFNTALIKDYWQLFWGNSAARFYPLNGREFLLLRQAGVMSAGLYLGIQAAKALLCAGLALGVLRRFGAPMGAACLAGLLLLATPAFLVSVNRLFIPELSSFTLFLAMLHLMPGPDDRRAGWGFWTALACANVALYYKEPGFVALGAFGAALLLASRNDRSPVRGRFAWALLVSCAVYLAAYYFLAYRFKGEQTYVSGRQLAMLDLLVYYLKNDTLLCLSLAALGALAPGLWSRGGQGRAAVAGLAGAAAYAGVFLALRITSPWYLLPAYAFALPALGAALGRASSAPGRFGRVALVAVVCVAGVSSVAGGVHHFSFNRAIGGELERVFDHLASLKRPPGAEPEVILVPRIGPDTEIAHALWVMLYSRDLSSRYALRFNERDDLSTYLSTRPGLVLLTPYTVYSDRELQSLAGCYDTLKSSPESARDYSLAGITPALLSSPTPAKEFLASSLRLHGNFVLLEGDMGRCSRPFDWSRLAFSAEINGLRVCPVGGARFPVTVTNTSDVEFLREKASVGNAVKLVLASARDADSWRFVAQKDLPERLGPGESATLTLSFSPRALTPAALSGYLGFLDDQGHMHLSWDGVVFSGHFKPEFAACVR